jgi:hypothetical protein
VCRCTIDRWKAGVVLIEHNRQVAPSQQYGLGTVALNKDACNLTETLDLRRRAAVMNDIHIGLVDLLNLFDFRHNDVYTETAEHAALHGETRAQQGDTLEATDLNFRCNFRNDVDKRIMIMPRFLA